MTMREHQQIPAMPPTRSLSSAWIWPLSHSAKEKEGALLHGPDVSEHVPAAPAGPVVETTGAAAGLASGMLPKEAVSYACAVAGISVTRSGTAPSTPMFFSGGQSTARSGNEAKTIGQLSPGMTSCTSTHATSEILNQPLSHGRPTAGP
jgi:hypothetical protein